MSDTAPPPSARSRTADGRSTEPVAAARPMQLFVCTTCRDRIGNPGARPGARLFADLESATRDPLVELRPVECLSVCKMNIALSFASQGKWTYVYGVPSNADVAEILEGARLYAEAPEGLIPWDLRPEILKRGVVARVPPQSTPRQ